MLIDNNYYYSKSSNIVELSSEFYEDGGNSEYALFEDSVMIRDEYYKKDDCNACIDNIYFTNGEIILETDIFHEADESYDGYVHIGSDYSDMNINENLFNLFFDIFIPDKILYGDDEYNSFNDFDSEIDVDFEYISKQYSIQIGPKYYFSMDRILLSLEGGKFVFDEYGCINFKEFVGDKELSMDEASKIAKFGNTFLSTLERIDTNYDEYANIIEATGDDFAKRISGLISEYDSYKSHFVRFYKIFGQYFNRDKPAFELHDSYEPGTKFNVSDIIYLPSKGGNFLKEDIRLVCNSMNVKTNNGLYTSTNISTVYVTEKDTTGIKLKDSEHYSKIEIINYILNYDSKMRLYKSDYTLNMPGINFNISPIGDASFNDIKSQREYFDNLYFTDLFNSDIVDEINLIIYSQMNIEGGLFQNERGIMW